jgi:hypothetical protein
MVLPTQAGSIPNLVAAAGKEGNLFLMNQSNMGGFHPTDQVVGTFPIGHCWCGPSYFSDGVNHIVSSGDHDVILWKVQTSPSTTLVKEGTSAAIPGAQDGGFFTSISSNGAI